MTLSAYIILGLIVFIAGILIYLTATSKFNRAAEPESQQLELESGSEHHALSRNQKRELLILAMRTIKRYLEDQTILDYATDDPLLNQPSGVFVTLRKSGALRGCIGHITALEPLFRGVQETAVAAATRDPRFPPVKIKEIEDISIKISVLSPLHQIDIDAIKVGAHGLMIVQGGKRGVLLPEVAVANGWDREAFLENLCLKAGLPRYCWKEDPMLYSFTTQKFGSDEKSEEEIIINYFQRK